MDKIAQYRKLIVALVATLFSGLALFAGIGDGTTVFGLDVEKVSAGVITLLGAIGVWWAKNEPPSQ